jgi:hypothetical protein
MLGSPSRAEFLGGLAAFAAAPGYGAITVLPAVFEGGRIFATPRLARDGAAMRLWLDTDGDGFVFAESVARLGLAVIRDPAGRSRTWTRLPPFAPDAAIPQPSARDGRLLIFARGADELRDPILAGFDGQLGGSWFHGRAWTFDYRAGRVLLRGPVRDSDGARVRVVGGDSPRVDVSVDGVTYPMSFDIAASVALTAAARDRFADALPAVRATSFIKAAQLARWRAAHPGWPVLEDVSVTRGTAAIRVPAVRVGPVALGPVWFTTRPSDDVFEGAGAIDGKLGAPAFADRIVTIDYPHAILAIR